MYSISSKNHINPCLNQLIITNEEINFKSVIYPNLGASLQKLSKNGIDILDGIDATEEELVRYEKLYNSSFLFPFPSRIENGNYNFNAKNYQLKINDKTYKNALHGHIHNKPFKLENKKVNKNNTTVKLTHNSKGHEEGFPFPYKISVTYAFTKNNVKIKFKINNTGINKFPFGIGWHPYFKSANLAESTLNFNPGSQTIFNSRMLPIDSVPFTINTPIQIKENEFDNSLKLNSSKSIFKTKDYIAKMKFSSKPPYSFLQIYTPPNRDCIAIEPLTCGGNVFNTKDGLLILNSGEKYKWEINLNFKIRE